MTLRLRLVAALVLLTTLGLGLFGVATRGVYARSEHERLDDQIRTSSGLVNRQLVEAAGLSTGPSRFGGNGGNGNGGGPQPAGGGGGGPGPAGAAVPPGAYAQLRKGSEVVQVLDYVAESTVDHDVPALPASAGPVDRTGTLLTVGSTDGSTRWRVLVVEAPGEGYTSLIAVPLTGVESALRRLTATLTFAALALLAVLGLGSWIVVRRGLLPLEHMAATAGRISDGALSERVTPADGRTEVGQLGAALNTMLERIEAAFAERDATEERLRQFLADASHELRTPLTSIRGFAELYRMGGDQVDLPVILRRIEEESARMKGLVEDLLLLARLDRTRPAEREPVDLVVLAADACADAKATAPDRAVTLDATEPVVVSGDQDHLRQAVANLVTNAVRHTPAGTPLEVGAKLVGGRAVLSVRDHGAGLDEEALAHVFDRFWQADRARVGTGAGLGLAIVEGIAREHGGTATAANAEGGGALFTVTLPLQA